MKNLALLLRPGENEELRYSLRSISTNLGEEHRLIVCGDKPDWLEPDIFIQGNPYPLRTIDDKYGNVRANWALLTKSEEVPEDLILLNDDFFLLKKKRSIPRYVRTESLEELATRFFQKYHRHTAYSKVLLETHWALKNAGVEEPHSYDLHKPMKFKKSLMAELLEEYAGTPGLSKRSLYGNLHGKGPIIPTEDTKYAVGLHPVATEGWFSTSDKAWPQVEFFFHLLFSEASPWELKS